MSGQIFKHSDLEKQVGILPDEVSYCKNCVISNQRPRITFNEEGVCSACQNTWYKEHGIDWDLREKELEELLDKYRRNDGYWDVVVPSSGGKDSIFVAHQLKHKWGMNPLTVTWSPMIYTDIGYRNYQHFVDSGFTNLFCNPNGEFNRKLARLSFEELGDAFHTFVLGQSAYPFQIAHKMDIPLVFYGENGALEYAGDPQLADKPYIAAEEWTSRFFKGCTLNELIRFGIDNKDYISEGDFQQSDLIFYQPPSVDELNKKGIRKYYYSYFHKWIPQENYYYATEHTSFEANPERSEGTYSKYASLDDRLDGMHYYMAYIKFGIGRATQDAAHEIRDGHITRDEGVALVKRYDGEFPQNYYADFLEYLDIAEGHFNAVVDSWRKENLWAREGDGWRLKHQVS